MALEKRDLTYVFTCYHKRQIGKPQRQAAMIMILPLTEDMDERLKGQSASGHGRLSDFWQESSSSLSESHNSVRPSSGHRSPPTLFSWLGHQREDTIASSVQECIGRTRVGCWWQRQMAIHYCGYQALVLSCPLCKQGSWQTVGVWVVDSRCQSWRKQFVPLWLCDQLGTFPTSSRKHFLCHLGNISWKGMQTQTL